MPLDPQMAPIIEMMRSPGAKPIREMTVDEARALGGAALAPPDDVHAVEDTTFDGPGGPVPVRIYRPSGDRPLPVVVYFHGGGFVIGSIDGHDGVCRSLANGSGCAVVNVGYRLAPEHRFPAAVEDAHAAVSWVAANAGTLGLDPARIAVAGDSAGGNLAAVTCLTARDRSGPDLAFQLLVYPNVDYEFDRPSMAEPKDEYLLSVEDMHWFWEKYLPDGADVSDPYIAPFQAKSLEGLPPALILSAEYDFLRDEDEDYARKLANDGVRVTLTRYPGLTHGFWGMGAIGISQAQLAMAEACDALRRALR